jgi:hypothetical protein
LLRRALFCSLLWTALAAAHVEATASEGIQWRPLELEFAAAMSDSEPSTVDLTVSFTGPGEERYDVLAFWDGGRRWLVRFAPTVPGVWSFATGCPASARDPGLHCRNGTVTVEPAQGKNPLFLHGGVLHVSPNKRYLTYSDGTPFFWLGDTWWFCPSALCPFDGSSKSGIPSMYRALVDTRTQQGFTVAQLAFLGTGGVSRFFKTSMWTPEAVEYWREVDRYFTYSNDAGLLLVIGIGFHRGLDSLTLTDLKMLWRYVVARYGAFATTWMIAGEYNLDNLDTRVQKVLDLGRYIKEIDPYRRAMTVHPTYYREDRHQAWAEPWQDFIMLQGGHTELLPPVRAYSDAYGQPNGKPIVEAESSYEGINRFSPERVRLAAYRAIQTGSFGYTYGAHGLWYPTQHRGDTSFFEYGGPSRPWWEALSLPGARQMTVLRDIYESLPWWNLEPRPDATVTAAPVPEHQRVLTKADRDTTFVIYFPPGLTPATKTFLRSTDPRAAYFGMWVDPRDGSTRVVMRDLRPDDQFLLLPAVPDRRDWILLLGKVHTDPSLLDVVP